MIRQFGGFFMALFIFMAAVQGCTCGAVDPGHVGIVVNMTGEKAGVAPEELGVGFYMVSPFKRVYEFPMFEQNHVWTHVKTEGSPRDDGFTFQTREGMPVGADMGITFHIQPGMAPVVFQRFRRPIDDIRDVFLHNYVRDSLNDVGGGMAVDQVYGEGKADLVKAVEKRVAAQLEGVGIKVVKISLVGKFRLPASVETALNNKVQASVDRDRAKSEAERAVVVADGEAKVKSAQATAEAARTVAQATAEASSIRLRAEAEAEANRKVSASITPTLVDYTRAKAWNGVLPSTVLGSSGSLLSIAK